MFKITAICLMFAYMTYSHPSGLQSYTVKGKLRCGNEPAKDVVVKLVDDDFGRDADDMLSESKTNSAGIFELSGNTVELTTIDVHLKIYHDCNDAEQCQRRWKFELPSSYISKAVNASKVLDIGEWNLEAVMPGESRDCEH